VVGVEQRQVVFVGQAPQVDAQQRPASQVERFGCGCGGLARCFGLALVFGQAAQIHHRDGLRRERVRGGDDLRRPAVNRREGGAQRLVPADDLGQRPFQRKDVQWPRQAHGRRDVVERAARLKLIQEPEPLLCERQRQRAVPWHRLDGRCGQPVGGAADLSDLSGQAGRAGGLKQGAQRELYPERITDAGDDLGRQQRVPAQLEEVVVRGDAGQAENLAEDAGHDLGLRRRRCGRRNPFVGCACGGQRLSGQGAAVHLAVGRQRDGVERHVKPRHHVVRQPLREERAQFGGGQELRQG